MKINVDHQYLEHVLSGGSSSESNGDDDPGVLSASSAVDATRRVPY